MDKVLQGKKVAVLVETEYIAQEVAYYKSFFIAQGAEVDFMTYLLGKPERTIVSDVTEVGQEVETMLVKKEIADCKGSIMSCIVDINTGAGAFERKEGYLSYSCFS